MLSMKDPPLLPTTETSLWNLTANHVIASDISEAFDIQTHTNVDYQVSL